jgi:hypothetical protein
VFPRCALVVDDAGDGHVFAPVLTALNLATPIRSMMSAHNSVIRRRFAQAPGALGAQKARKEHVNSANVHRYTALIVYVLSSEYRYWNVATTRAKEEPKALQLSSQLLELGDGR